MSTTLTNGLKLPDKGSVDWYADMQSNYTILDGAVGTVAEHTSQIAGKAADSGVVHKTRNETIEGVKSFLNTNIRFNSSEYVSGTPSANIFYAPILIGGVVNNADKNTFQHNAAIRTTGINDYSIRVYSQTSNTLTGVVSETNADASNISFRPIANNTHNLGTSSYKWKSLNGINPGALSLPDITRKSSISEYITDLTGGLQYYTPVADGWICIQSDNSSTANYIRCAYDDILVKANGNGQAQGLSVLIPVLAGVQIGIRVVCTTLSSAYFYHCQGNAS